MTLTYPQTDLANYNGTVATIHTNLGDLTVKLFDDVAPKTVKNFVELAETGYYDGVIFHRIIRDFMIQGGDPTGTGMGGASIYGEKFEDEFSDKAFNIRGALSMANAVPNTNGSQFFIDENQNLHYDKSALVKGGWPEEIAELYLEGGTPHLDGRHTVFGQLLDAASFETLDRIAKAPTGAQDKPKDAIEMISIELEKKSDEA